KNVGLYVGSTADTPDQAEINAQSGGRATSGRFDSIIVENWTEDCPMPLVGPACRNRHKVAGVIVHGTYDVNANGRLQDSKHMDVSFLGPFLFNNYQGFQIDRSSLVHFPSSQSKLAVNAPVGLTAPGFIPPFNSSGGTASAVLHGTFVPAAGVIAHSGQAGMILPPDVNCSGNGGRVPCADGVFSGNSI